MQRKQRKLLSSYAQNFEHKENSFSTNSSLEAKKIPNQKVKTNLCKYKTEMCKNFSENGTCPYRSKCQFAHGDEQIISIHIERKKQYRTEKCKNFWGKKSCPYGERCQFEHLEKKNKDQARFLRLAYQMLKNGENPMCMQSKINFQN